jgi:splicing factor 3B subunit 1
MFFRRKFYNDSLNLQSIKTRSEKVKVIGKEVESDNDFDENLGKVKEKIVLKLIMKIKDGDEQQRRDSFKHILHHYEELGMSSILDKLLSLVLSHSTSGYVRHIFLRLVENIINRIGAHVRPFVNKLMLILMPMLIDEDFIVRLEGRGLITSISRAAGKHCIISCLRPDIESDDEYVRGTTARTLSVIVSAFGLDSMMPFLKALLGSKRN